jgi:serine/threonine protein kinase
MGSSSIESVCNLVIRSCLLSADDVRTVSERWQKEVGAAADGAEFLSWLVAQQYLTEYQAGLLRRGKADHFYLNQYKILDRVGKGRMAGVYKAVHQLGQVVAIKVLPPSKAKDPQLLARFQREARMALRLKHPNVVRTVEVGETDGLHFIVMEYVDGESLEDVLRRRCKLPPAEAVRLIHQSLQGLQHTHEQGLVHRDLKPGNLMLTPAWEPGLPDETLKSTVKILDIGLGRAFFDEGGGADNFNLTNEGTLLGTPEYLAPEQARDAHQADIRADIYSLGCVLYHALTGQPPFVEKNLVRLLVRHATEMPRPLREFNPALADGLQEIMNSMLAKDPAQRFPTPERAAHALGRYLAAPSPQPPGKKPSASHEQPAAPGVTPLSPKTAPATPGSKPLPSPPAAAAASAPGRSATNVARAKPAPAAKYSPTVVEKPADLDLELFSQRGRGGLNRRDLLMILSGAAGLLLLEGLGYLIVQGVSRKEGEGESSPTDGRD